MNIGVYDEIWQSFLHGDHVSRGSIWGGEGLALIIPIEEPKVLGNIAHIQARLSGHLPFSPLPPDVLHITLYLFGNPPGIRISDLSAYLQSTLVDIPAFGLELKQVNSFFRAPFLEVHDPTALNHLLASIQPGLRAMGYPGANYGERGQIWHVTLGAYTQSNDGTVARKIIKVLRGQSAGLLPVNELRLVKTSAGLPYRLEILDHFSLPS